MPVVTDPQAPPAQELDPNKPNSGRIKIAEPPRRTGHIAVFISRKEKKLYVRQGFQPCAQPSGYGRDSSRGDGALRMKPSILVSRSG